MSIKFKSVSYVYQAHTPFENLSLKDVNLTIPTGSYTAIIGHTGSGKSTLIQHVNGLLKPTTGTVEVDNQVIDATTKNKALVALRQHVGIVFQFPESQLFAETVLDDVKFGPLNFGLSDAEATQRAQQALAKVHMPESTWQKSPFELSGGQMRRVAIAGILATNPAILILDEPTAGLDPQGRTEMMELFAELHDQEHLTILLVTHQMDDVANYADQVVVMDDGQIIKVGSPRTVFSAPEWLLEHQLGLPQVTEFAQRLMQRGFHFNPVPLQMGELIEQLKQNGGHARE
ncbi:energy-coupling factor ABC transporter ATP-binding protein [Pediococcus acidilactici]